MTTGVVSKTKGRQLTTEDVAGIMGVLPSTVSGYRSRGLMPEPDGQLGRTVWWWETTVDAWLDERPGKGWRKGLAADKDEGAA